MAAAAAAARLATASRAFFFEGRHQSLPPASGSRLKGSRREPGGGFKDWMKRLPAMVEKNVHAAPSVSQLQGLKV